MKLEVKLIGVSLIIQFICILFIFHLLETVSYPSPNNQINSTISIRQINSSSVVDNNIVKRPEVRKYLSELMRNTTNHCKHLVPVGFCEKRNFCQQGLWDSFCSTIKLTETNGNVWWNENSTLGKN